MSIFVNGHPGRKTEAAMMTTIADVFHFIESLSPQQQEEMIKAGIITEDQGREFQGLMRHIQSLSSEEEQELLEAIKNDGYQVIEFNHAIDVLSSIIFMSESNQKMRNDYVNEVIGTMIVCTVIGTAMTLSIKPQGHEIGEAILGSLVFPFIITIGGKFFNHIFKYNLGKEMKNMVKEFQPKASQSSQAMRTMGGGATSSLEVLFRRAIAPPENTASAKLDLLRKELEKYTVRYKEASAVILLLEHQTPELLNSDMRLQTEVGKLLSLIPSSLLEDLFKQVIAPSENLALLRKGFGQYKEQSGAARAAVVLLENKSPESLRLSQEAQGRLTSLIGMIGHDMTRASVGNGRRFQVNGAMETISHRKAVLPFGGIDLTTADSGMTVTKDANGGVKVNFDPAMIARIRQKGVQSALPVIINVTDLSPDQIPPLLGFNESQPQHNLARI